MTEPYADWIGRSEAVEEAICPVQAQRMAVTMGTDPAEVPAGAPLPPLWHWIAFAPAAPHPGLGPDGHPARGGFLPPVPLERRMWAGGRVTFHDAPRVGEPMHKRSEILKIVEKSGGAGQMVFVTVLHELSTARGPAVREEQDIVYIAMPDRFRPPPATPAPEAPDWAEDFALDPVRLFRFSAVTFNGHRIHYDQDYASGVEKYPGLVVHGPMQAIAMMQAACRRQGAQPRTYSYRGVHPMFHTDRMQVLGVTEAPGRVAVCTANGAGTVCMKGVVEFPG